jgi:hypothetical protein
MNRWIKRGKREDEVEDGLFYIYIFLLLFFFL